MRKPIFESELQFRQFFSDCIPVNSDEPNFFTLRNSMEQAAKQHDWIKRSPVEEAEETYKEFEKNLKDNELYIPFSGLIFKQHKAIQYLKKQLEDTEEK
jgi:hypothetical protein